MIMYAHGRDDSMIVFLIFALFFVYSNNKHANLDSTGRIRSDWFSTGREKRWSGKHGCAVRIRISPCWCAYFHRLQW